MLSTQICARAELLLVVKFIDVFMLGLTQYCEFVKNTVFRVFAMLNNAPLHPDDTFVYNTTMDRQNDVPIPFHVITKPYTNPLVVYNRVSKCGSSTMIWICRQLARRNHFFTRTESMAVMNMSFSETKKVNTIACAR